MHSKPGRARKNILSGKVLVGKILGVEGIVGNMDAKVNGLTGRVWDWCGQINYERGHEPSLIGATQHILYVGNKT